MQPTKYRTSTLSPFFATSAMVRTPRSLAQSARVPRPICQGLPFFSRLLKTGMTSAGKRDSSSTRLRRISTIFGTCSIITGQASTHQRQVVHDHSVSSATTAPIKGRRPGRALPSWPAFFAATRASPISNSSCLRFCTSSLGESGLSLSRAGQLRSQRPHSVQEYRSSRCFQENYSRRPTPKLSASSMFSMGRSAPLGPDWRK